MGTKQQEAQVARKNGTGDNPHVYTSRCVVIDDATWHLAVAEAERRSTLEHRRVSVSELVRAALRQTLTTEEAA